jgi:hypothetical protein
MKARKNKLDKDFEKASKFLDNDNYKKALKFFLKSYRHGYTDRALNIVMTECQHL